MNPTPNQLKLLRLYHEYQIHPPCAGTCVRRNLFPLSFLTLIVIAGTWLAFTAEGTWFGVGCFGAGLGLGSLIRVIRQLANSVRLWPLLCEIVDWNKVDALLAQKSSS